MIASLVTSGSGGGQEAEQFSTWQQQGKTNVGEVERWLSLAGGGTLALIGLTRGGLGGLALGLLGGAFMYRGATGHCSLYSTLGVNTAEASQYPATEGAGKSGEHPTATNPSVSRF